MQTGGTCYGQQRANQHTVMLSANQLWTILYDDEDLTEAKVPVKGGVYGHETLPQGDHSKWVNKFCFDLDMESFVPRRGNNKAKREYVCRGHASAPKTKTVAKSQRTVTEGGAVNSVPDNNNSVSSITLDGEEAIADDAAAAVVQSCPAFFKMTVRKGQWTCSDLNGYYCFLCSSAMATLVCHLLPFNKVDGTSILYRSCATFDPVTLTTKFQNFISTDFLSSISKKSCFETFDPYY
jgi:hypothetical protein